MRRSKPTTAQLQGLIWTFVYLIQFLSMLAVDSTTEALVYAMLNTIFYAVIIYGNISLLYPWLYQKGRTVLYAAAVLVFLGASGILWTSAVIYTYKHIFSNPNPVQNNVLVRYVLGGFMVFLLSFIFRIALAYFKLKSLNEEILVQKTQAELDLLKSKVQPHFLFNTLNNIYYEAYLEAPRTAALIEQLSGIMRYFVDESPKAVVPLKTEIDFIENYIALEQIRMRHAIDCDLSVTADISLLLPPMLLMTFIENIFKHGIDKNSAVNKISIKIGEREKFLIFRTKNIFRDNADHSPAGGFGLVNLRGRLQLLYKDNFELTTSAEDHLFIATLKIPL